VETEKKRFSLGQKIGFISTGILIIMFILIVSFLPRSEAPKNNFIIFLDKNQVEDFEICDGFWNYHEIEFIPCLWEGNLSAIPQDYMNWNASPQDNCLDYNGTFPGFNLYNETKAKEMYDKTIPKCYKQTPATIEEVWLNASCICTELCDQELCTLKKENETYTDYKFEDCTKFECGENLVILRGENGIN